MSIKHRDLFKNDQPGKKSLKITFIYFVIGCIWIVISDSLTEFLSDSHFNHIFINISKGLVYVTVTAIIIYKLIYDVLLELTNSEEKLKENGILFQTIFEQSPIGIMITDQKCIFDDNLGNLSGINPMIEKITGRTKDEIMRLGWDKITHPQDLEQDIINSLKLQSGEIKNYTMEKRYIKPDGSIVWVNIIVAPLNIMNSGKCNQLFLIQDITERKAMEKTINESERSKAVLLSNLPGMAYRCNYDSEWTMQFVSQGCFELTGYEPESLINNRDISFNDLILPDYRQTLRLEWMKTLNKKIPFKHEYEIITANKDKKWVLEMGQGIFDDKDELEALEGIIIDISDRKEYELKLQHVSEIDSLSGLYNRRFLENVIAEDAACDVNESKAVILLNIRKINSISMAYGYSFSDNLLKELAAGLLKLCFEKCQLFHVSYERFAFYYKGYKNTEEIEHFCNRIVEKINNIQLLKIIGFGIGVYEIERLCCDSESIIKNATIAAELVDDNNRVAYHFFDNEMYDSLRRNKYIKEALIGEASSIKNDVIYLEYQPILDLKVDKIEGFEALARFKSEKLGIISPSEFIPIAEETELIVPIGKKIIRMGCEFLKKLYKLGFKDIIIYINISAIQLMNEYFINDFISIIKEYEVNAANIGLEITESLFAQNYLVINERLGTLREMGIKISIDDFGTGYSSLARERELNIDCLKIDKYFINKLTNVDKEESITGDIISMAHKLGHCVVAEGVEQEEQKKYLVKHNCDLMQGYLLSKPVNEEKAIDILYDKFNK